MLPEDAVHDLVDTHGLTIKDAKTLVNLDDGERLDYFDRVLELYRKKLDHYESFESARLAQRSRLVANW